MTFSFFKDIAERRVFRYLLAYAAAGWVLLQVVDQLANNFPLPAFTYRAAFVFIVCGLPGALVVAWFHGAKGRQESSRLERVLLAGVAVFALTSTGFVVRAGLKDAPGNASRATLTPDKDPSRLAVLYFEPRGGGDAEFMAAGLTETLIDVLSKVKALHVVSRNGSQLFKGVTAAPDSISRTLQVGTIVTGTVSQAGERVRVDVSITNSEGKQFNSTSLERPRSEIFALQTELADTVAVFLRKAIGSELGDLRLRMGTNSVPAWEMVQRSRQAANEADTYVKGSDLNGASRVLTQADSILALAEAEDPNWAEPSIQRGWLAYRQSRLGGMNRESYAKWIGEGVAHADRAIKLDTTNAGGFEVRATLTYWRYLQNLAGPPDEAARVRDEAEDGFRDAIVRDETRASALTSLSHLLLNKGEVTEAKLKALAAYEADPFLENVHLTIWRIFTSSWSGGDEVEARRYCQEGVRRFPADFRFRQCQLMAYALPGSPPDLKNAWTLVREFAEMSPPQLRDVNQQRGYVYVAMGLARANMADSARAVLRQVRAGPEIDPSREIARLESIVRTWIGDKEEAVRQLAVFFAANPAELVGYRNDAQKGQLIWYHQALLEEPKFRSLVGLR